MSDFLHVWLSHLPCLRFFFRDSMFPPEVLPSYWPLNFLLNHSEGALGRWSKTTTHLHMACKKFIITYSPSPFLIPNPPTISLPLFFKFLVSISWISNYIHICICISFFPKCNMLTPYNVTCMYVSGLTIWHWTINWLVYSSLGR